MIGLGKQSNGLYLLQAFVPPSRSTTLVTNVSHTSSSDLWHSRLGHLSLSKLQLLKHFVDIDVQNKATCCDVCHFSKQKRLSFPSNSHVTTKPFELIHCDLLGPFSVNTIDGYKYFLTIVDDYTRCTWVYLLKHKSKTQFLFPKFASMVSTQFDSKIKTIRSDNGTKFFLKQFFHSNGILHQLSCVDTPQQNLWWYEGKQNHPNKK